METILQTEVAEVGVDPILQAQLCCQAQAEAAEAVGVVVSQAVCQPEAPQRWANPVERAKWEEIGQPEAEEATLQQVEIGAEMPAGQVALGIRLEAKCMLPEEAEEQDVPLATQPERQVDHWQVREQSCPTLPHQVRQDPDVEEEVVLVTGQAPRVDRPETAGAASFTSSGSEHPWSQ